MELLTQLEGIRSPFLDTVIGLITRLGEETIGVAILCAIFWCISKRAGYTIGVVFFLSGLAVQGMKVIFRVERPWEIDPGFRPVEAAKLEATGYSFPSGHTQSATALFGTLGAVIKQKPVKALCFLITVIVAFSRLYLGVHTPQDVIASLAIAYLFVLLVVVFRKDEQIDVKREAIISAAMAVFAIAVVVIAAVLYSNGTIEEEYISDCLKAAGAGIGFAVGMFIERVYIGFSVKTKSLIWQIVKYVIGIAIVLALKEGLKLLIGTGFVANALRYFVLISWIVVLYPLIIKRFFEVRQQGDEPLPPDEDSGEEM